MSFDQASVKQIITRLEACLAAGTLAPSAQAQAAELCERLTRGVRIVLLGPCGVGKSQLAHIIAGCPQTAASSQILRYHRPAEDHRPISELSCDAGPTLSSVAIQSPALADIELIDVPGSEDAVLHQCLTSWGIGVADVVIWCTQDFSDIEFADWATAAEPLKDHSFVVLTKADVLARDGALASRINRLRAIAQEEFHGFYPTTTFQAAGALAKEGHVPEQLMSQSGVKALIETLTNLAASGRMADLDGAELFLKRFGLSDNTTPKEPVVAPQDTLQRDDGPGGVYARTIDLIRNKAMAIEVKLFSEQEDCASDVLEHCADLSQDLLDIVSIGDHPDPGFHAWVTDMQDAADKLLLMGLESGMRSAADAVTILLQLSRDTEMRRIS